MLAQGQYGKASEDRREEAEPIAKKLKRVDCHFMLPNCQVMGKVRARR
jgi:hypothetical protein